MGNVIKWTGKTTIPQTPDEVLEKCKGVFTDCVVIGVTHDSMIRIEVAGTQCAKNGDIYFLLAQAQQMILEFDDVQ